MLIAVLAAISALSDGQGADGRRVVQETSTERWTSIWAAMTSLQMGLDPAFSITRRKMLPWTASETDRMKAACWTVLRWKALTCLRCPSGGAWDVAKWEFNLRVKLNWDDGYGYGLKGRTTWCGNIFSKRWPQSNYLVTSHHWWTAVHQC